MDQPDSASQALDNAAPSGDAPGEAAAASAPCAGAPGETGPEPVAPKVPAGPAPASKRVERPLTVGQLQRVLEMRLGFTVSINTLERWCRQAKIYAVRLGPEWRIPRQAVEELIKAALNGERL